MYDYDYETDILLLLRLLKFMQEDDPRSFKHLIDDYEVLDLDSLYEIADSIHCGEYGFIEQDFDADRELDALCITHPVIDRFLKLSDDWLENGGTGSPELFQKKVQDIVEFYISGATYSVIAVKCFFASASVRIWLTLSPDFYEPLVLPNTLVDLLLHFKLENQRMEKRLKARLAEASLSSELAKEAA